MTSSHYFAGAFDISVFSRSTEIESWSKFFVITSLNSFLVNHCNLVKIAAPKQSYALIVSHFSIDDHSDSVCQNNTWSFLKHEKLEEITYQLLSPPVEGVS